MLSKLVWLVLRPESWGFFLLLLALWAVWRGRRLIAFGALTLILLGYVLIAPGILSKILMDPLEARFAPHPKVDRIDGIIVLGGGEIASYSARTGLVHLNHAGERLTAGVALAHEFPEAKLIFTGGSGRVFGAKFVGGDAASMLFERLNIPKNRILIEKTSRNTAENARFLKEKLTPKAQQHWLLVTSAFHMPRAIGSFCAAGWQNITAYPTDYRTLYDRAPPLIRFAHNLDLVNLAAHEWLGNLVYWQTGRSSDFLPSGCGGK